ncbi:MAG: CHRD domain-containing protein, partial [Planctomycetota bacterium]
TIDMVVFGITLQELLGVGPNNSPAHIHMAPAGANGPIVVDLGFLAGGFQQSGLGIRLQIPDALFGGVQGGVNSDPATNAAALLAGNLYVNVHTQEFPGGEIRAQIPEPAALALLGVGLALQARRRR